MDNDKILSNREDGMDNQNAEISMATFRRMPLYLRCLYEMQDNGKEYVSTVALAEGVFKNPSVVKKDLSYVIKNEGKPKVGHKVKDLINDIEEFLGYDNTHDAILVGVGKLGQALLGYKGFDEWGLRIVAGFDVNSDIVGKTINGKEIIDMKQMPTEIAKRNIKMAVLTVPQEFAQGIVDELVKAGIQAIWNFTPCRLKVPNTVALKHENMASSLAVLSRQLKEILRKEAK